MGQETVANGPGILGTVLRTGSQVNGVLGMRRHGPLRPVEF